MKFFGKQDSIGTDLMSLEEVTLVLNKDEMMQLFSFIKKCISEMDENPQWEHSHFNDFISSKERGGLIIFSEAEMPR